MKRIESSAFLTTHQKKNFLKACNRDGTLKHMDNSLTTLLKDERVITIDMDQVKEQYRLTEKGVQFKIQLQEELLERAGKKTMAWISLFISIIALIISSLSLYFNSF